jgi:hypothetical protein
VVRKIMQPASLCGCTPIRLRRMAEGESNPIDELGKQMYASRFRCLSEWRKLCQQ